MSCGSEDCHELPTITSRLTFVACRGGRRSTKGRSRRAIYLRRPGRSLHRDWQSHSIMPARRPSTTDASATALCFQGPWRRCAQEGRFGPALCSTERAKPGAKCCARTQLLRSSWSLDATIKRYARSEHPVHHPCYAQIPGWDSALPAAIGAVSLSDSWLKKACRTGPQTIDLQGEQSR